MNKITSALLLSVGLICQPVLSSPATDQLISEYSAETGQAPEPEAGKQLWYRDFNGRSCTQCHQSDPTAMGRHAKTGKVIDPIAPSVTTDRLTDPKKIQKWLLRNCQWTLGRDCTATEKADVLSWLIKQ